MSDLTFEIESGKTKRFHTEGKYCESDIVVMAKDGGGEVDTSIEDAILDGSLSGTYTNNRITTIRGHAFRETKLEIFNSESLTNISPYGFYNASTIKECNIPNVIEIGTNAFYGCSSLKRIELPNFNTGISQAAFSNCTSLEYLNIGKASFIANGVFTGCKALKTLVITKDDDICPLKYANTLNSSVVGSVVNVYVPDALVDAYKSATNWSPCAEQIKPMSELP